MQSSFLVIRKTDFVCAYTDDTKMSTIQLNEMYTKRTRRCIDILESPFYTENKDKFVFGKGKWTAVYGSEADKVQ